MTPPPMTDDRPIVPVFLRVRRGLALPINAALSFASDPLGDLAAWIAGDDWPR